MFITCPNRCSDATLEEVSNNALIVTPITGGDDSGITVGDTAILSHGDTFCRCSQCGHDFGSLSNTEILRLIKGEC